MKLAAASLNQTPFDWSGNFNRIASVLSCAREQAVDILCLPGLCVSSNGCEDMFLSGSLQKTVMGVFLDLLPACRGIVATLGLPLEFEGKLYNAVALVRNGKILGFHARTKHERTGIYYANRWFEDWTPGRTAEIEIHGTKYPIGDALVHACGPITVGIESGDFSSAPDTFEKEPDIVLHPGAMPFSLGNYAVLREKLIQRSREIAPKGYVYANCVGNESGRFIYDGGSLIALGGRIQSESPRFSFGLASMTMHDDTDGPEETRPLSKEEELAISVPLALFDYLRKSKSHGFVLSLSGGADSAAVAIFVRLCVDLATTELGIDGVTSRLMHIPGIEEARDENELMKRLLLCVYQGTRNSSKTTENAASALAGAIHADYLKFDVDPMFKQYVETLEKAIGRKLDWKTDDIALQNIQARVRGPGAWMLANIRNSLLLATGNRSEAALGYATMDGDTCGSLSPISGIDKAFLRKWLLWMETEGLEIRYRTEIEGSGEIFSDKKVVTLRFPSLHAINVQQPTAELRPPGCGQTDEADLMPYPVLNQIESLMIGEKLAPAEVMRKLMQSDTATEYTPEQLKSWIERFFKLWGRNQWKRHRFAPGFHLDERNLAPDSWCRYPLLSGE